MALINDVKLTTTLFGPVSLTDKQGTGFGRKIAEWLKPTLTVESDIFGTQDIALFGKAQPIPKETFILLAIGLFLIIRKIARRK